MTSGAPRFSTPPAVEIENPEFEIQNPRGVRSPPHIHDCIKTPRLVPPHFWHAWRYRGCLKAPGAEDAVGTAIGGWAPGVEIDVIRTIGVGSASRQPSPWACARLTCRLYMRWVSRISGQSVSFPPPGVRGWLNLSMPWHGAAAFTNRSSSTCGRWSMTACQRLASVFRCQRHPGRS